MREFHKNVDFSNNNRVSPEINKTRIASPGKERFSIDRGKIFFIVYNLSK
jgi:hypothetical protein